MRGSGASRTNAAARSHCQGQASRSCPRKQLYLLSLGGQHGNSHVHFHLAALPPRVPHEQQQVGALMPERAGLLDVSDEEQALLAEQIRNAVIREQGPITLVRTCRRVRGRARSRTWGDSRETAFFAASLSRLGRWRMAPPRRA